MKTGISSAIGDWKYPRIRDLEAIDHRDDSSGPPLANLGIGTATSRDHSDKTSMQNAADLVTV